MRLFCCIFFFFNFCLGNTKISNLVFRGFVQTPEVRPVSASMHPSSSASTGAGSSSPSGRGACQKIHETLQRGVQYPTDYPKASQEER